MKIDYSKIINRAFHFSYRPKQWMPFLITDTVFALFALFIFINNIDTLMGMVTGSIDQSVNIDSVMPVMNILLALGLVFVVWMVIRLWVSGAIVHQSHKEKESKKSWKISRNRLIPIIIATLLTGIIGVFGGMIPTVGWVVNLVIGWMFFFVLQAIIIDNLGAVESIKKSYHIFARNPFDVFVVWLVILIVSVSITLVFAIPFIATFIGSFVTMAATEAASTEFLTFFALALQDNLLLGIVMGIIALVGVEISTVFTLKAQTEFYLRAGKKRFGR